MDTGNYKLYAMYEEDGEVTEFDKSSNQFQSASGLAVDERGVIYVADSGNNRILIVSKDLKLIGELCVDKGLHCPLSVGLDTQRNEMVVHNAESQEIVKYNLGKISNIA